MSRLFPPRNPPDNAFSWSCCNCVCKSIISHATKLSSAVLGLYFSMPSHMGKKKHYLKLSVCLLQFKALCSPPLSLTLHLLASQLQPEIEEILKKSKRLSRITCLDTLSSFSCSLGQKSDKSLLVSEYRIIMSRKDVESFKRNCAPILGNFWQNLKGGGGAAVGR